MGRETGLLGWDGSSVGAYGWRMRQSSPSSFFPQCLGQHSMPVLAEGGDGRVKEVETLGMFGRLYDKRQALTFPVTVLSIPILFRLCTTCFSLPGFKLSLFYLLTLLG